MSSVLTKFAAKRQEIKTQDQEFEKVNWLHPQVIGDAMELSISEKSGLVKLNLGAGRRNPSLYANEIRAILTYGEEIMAYLDSHKEAKDAPMKVKGGAELVEKVKTELAKQAYRQALEDAGIDKTQIEVALVKKFGA